MEPLDTRNTITPKELNECDREPLHHIGSLQGGTGNCLFFEYPSGKIIGHDEQIHRVQWIRRRAERAVSTDAMKLRASPNVLSGTDTLASHSLPERRDSIVSDNDSQSTATESVNHGLLSEGDDASLEMLGTLLESWIPSRLYSTIISIVQGMQKSFSLRSFHFYVYKSVSYAISVSTTMNDYSVVSIEIEETENVNESAESFCSTLVHLGRIVEFYAHDTIAMAACDAVFNVMGNYDRGMVYRFDQDLSGEVIHEITKDDVKTSYLGLRFPSSDIPYSARQLYIKNGLRYINDVDADTVLMRSADGVQLDLSQIRMRAVAKPHIIYLRNMGVVCSLSIALVIENELWGLFAFHGYKQPFRPALHQRIACETISRMVSVKIESLVKKAESVRTNKLGITMMNFNQDQTVIHNLHNLDGSILEILDVDVLMVNVQDPRDNEGDQLLLGDQSLKVSDVFWKTLRLHPNRELFVAASRKDIDALGVSEVDCPSYGVIYFREGRTQVMLGRAMQARNVKWGGNPDEPKLRIGGILNPRKSFETYMEKAKLEARDWSPQDLNVISVLRDRICEHCHNWMMNMLRHDIEDTNQKYFAAIQKAQDNNEFFARMSHELRTPFHGVMGCLDILQDKHDSMSSADINDIVKTAISSGNHMMNLLNDILDISKNKHLSHNVTRKEVIYQSLAFEAIDCMKSFGASRQIQFLCEVVPNEKKIRIAADRTKIIQIVSNIVGNAIKFCAGRGLVSIKFKLLNTVQEGAAEWESNASTYAGVAFTMKEGEMLTSTTAVRERVADVPENPQEKWILIYVADTGCGMKPSELVEMFSPYTQSSLGTNRAFQGTGLGLFICVILCHQMSGFLACASTPDVGTVFHICIPVELCDDSWTQDGHFVRSPTPPIVENKSDIIPLCGPVFITDDNLVNLKILKRLLERQLEVHNLKLDIMTTESGDSCIELYKKRRPSLLFIDYHMPNKDGVETTADIRTYERQNDLPPAYIICYTADATDKAKKIIFESGANDIMFKPPQKGFLPNLVSRFRMKNGNKDEDVQVC